MITNGTQLQVRAGGRNWARPAAAGRNGRRAVVVLATPPAPACSFLACATATPSPYPQVTDNSGAKVVQCINQTGKVWRIGDIITVSVKRAQPRSKVAAGQVRVVCVCVWGGR
jgi:Ribosomal protein L14p/L23e